MVSTLYLSLMKYGIFYMATSVYKNYFDNFIKTVKYIFPDKYKELIVISDGLEEYHGKIINKNTYVEVEKIIDYPYPLINLCKFQTIYHYAKKHNIDRILYFDADTIIFEKNQDFWNYVDKLLSTDKLICSYHPHYLYNNESIFRNNGFLYNDKELAVYCDPENIHKNKCYIMSSFFMGSIKAVEYAYKEIYKMSSIDLKNFRWIPWFSDETYLNTLNVNDNIINNIGSIYLNKFITINPYNFNGVHYDDGNIWHNNFPIHNTIFINQKYDITIKDQKREDIKI